MTADASAVVEALRQRSKRLSAQPPPPQRPASPPPDYLAPFLPPSQSATASLPLSASLLFSPAPSHLLTSSYLQQRQRHYSSAAWASLLSSLSSSSTLYVGNLSFTTREETVYDVFSHCGRVAALYMGLNAQSHRPCGFCFVRFAHEHAARRAKWWLHGARLDGRVCGVDFDQAFRAGRQWGRGKTGGQIRDDHRSSYDEGRGGWGTRERLKKQQEAMQSSQVSQFKPIRGGVEGEGREGGEEEEEGEGRAAVKREGRTYADANARRKAATFAALTHAAAAQAEDGREEEEAPSVKRQRVKGQATEAGSTEAMDDGANTENDAGEEYEGGHQGNGEEGWMAGSEQREAMGDEGFASHGEAPRDGEANREEGEEEEVEHGFAAPAADDDTADPEWS